MDYLYGETFTHLGEGQYKLHLEFSDVCHKMASGTAVFFILAE